MGEIKFVKTCDEMRAHPTFAKAKDLCDKHGYELQIMVNEVYEDGANYAKLHLVHKTGNEYAPYIHLTDVAPFGSGMQEWKYHIGTVSYGALNFEEYEKFLKATADAYELAKQLKEIDFDDWPQIDKRQ